MAVLLAKEPSDILLSGYIGNNVLEVEDRFQMMKDILDLTSFRTRKNIRVRA